MHKFFMLAFLFSLGTSLVTGQSITVTSPTRGDSWCLGSAHTITWTPSGAMQGTVAIRLRAAGSSESAPAVVTIANGEANDGSFSWTVPTSVAPGSYFIRVRTDDSTVIGDSIPFTIANCSALSVTSIIIPAVVIDPCRTNQGGPTDLHLEDAQFLWIYSGGYPVTNDKARAFKYSFFIHNVGPRCITSLKWRMIYQTNHPNYNRRDLLPYEGQYDSAHGQWVLRAGERKHIEGYLNWTNCCAGQSQRDGHLVTLIKVILDPNNDIIETNEENNTTRGPGCTSDGYVILTYPDDSFCDRH